MTARTRPDWEAIERDFRTGKFTVRELGAKHGTSYSQISRRATKEGWTKDLRGVIREATAAAVIRETVAAASAGAQTATAETVLVAAEVSKQVILQHRGDLGSARAVAMDLLGELRGAALLAEHTDVLVKILAGADAEPADTAKAQKAVHRALSVGSRISSVKALADALAKLQAAERVAFDLDGDDGDDDTPELTEQLAGFLGQLHQSGAGRLPIAKKAPKA